MRDEEIKMCPFRTMTETFPPYLKGDGEVVRMRFEPCMKEQCPAFYVAHGGYGQEYERCKRLN
nr:MAG TPA: hypothetical protein [Caudoviricetes sp.]